MCTSWSKSLLMLGVMGSLVNHWFIIVAIYPLMASLVSRLSGRNVWPATASCRLPANQAEHRQERSS